MKKILAIILASLMLFTLVSCGNGNNEETTTDAPANNEETTLGGNEETTEGGNEEVNAGVVAPSVGEDTWGHAFWTAFSEIVKSNPEMATGEIVYNLLMSEAGQALGMAESVDVVPGMLTGFGSEDNPVEITGFKNASMFVPFASGYAFVGYVFELESTANVNTFMQTLNENHNLRWMVCMDADLATMGAYENYVLFVMSPYAMPGAMGGEANIYYPENAEDNTYAAEIWNFFEQAMSESAGMGSAEEMSYAVAYSPVVPFNMAMVNPVDTTVENAHFANGFDCVESIFSITEEGSDLVIYVFNIELGLEPANWGSWYVTGEGVVWGAYNNVIIAIHGGNAYIQ